MGTYSKNLGKVIENVIVEAAKKGIKVLEFDWKVVGDKSRVCRLPGTTNSKARSICTLHKVYKKNGQPIYYSLSELAQYIPATEEKIKAPKNPDIFDLCAFKLSPMLYRRIEKLRRAQNIFYDKIGNRELLCFFYYCKLMRNIFLIER